MAAVVLAAAAAAVLARAALMLAAVVVALRPGLVLVLVAVLRLRLGRWRGGREVALVDHGHAGLAGRGGGGGLLGGLVLGVQVVADREHGHDGQPAPQRQRPHL